MIKNIKCYISIAIFILCNTHNVQAQLSQNALSKHLKAKSESLKNKSVIISNDTIFNTSIPYGILRKEKTGSMSIGFSILTIEGKEVLYIKTSLSEGVSKFRPMLKEYQAASYTEAMGSLKIAETLVKYDLLSPSNLNIKQYQIFQEKYKVVRGLKNKKADNNDIPTTYNTSTKAILAERDTKGELTILENSIVQSKITIGTYESKQTDIAIVYSIYHLDNSLCATLTIQNTNKETMVLITQQDKKKATFRQSKKGLHLKETLKFLIARSYL